jgi:hypothetical protein
VKIGVKIEGVDTALVSPPLTLTSATGLALNFSGLAPGWTVGQWSGYDIMFSAGPSAIAAKQKRTILWNTTDTIYLGVLPETAAAGPPVAGDEFYIVEPAATLDISSSGRICLIGGTGYNPRLGSGRLSVEPRVTLQNLSLVNSQTTGATVSLTGSFRLNGVHFIRSTPGYLIIAAQNIQSGTFVEAASDPDRMLNGWAMSTRGAIRPLLQLNSLVSELNGYSGGQVTAINAALLMLHSGMAAEGVGTWPHGAWGSAGGAMISTQVSSVAKIWAQGTIADFSTEGGFIELYTAVNHLATCDFARVQDGGQVDIAATPVAFGGAGGMGTVCRFGSRIRLNVDGSTLGPAVLGAVAPVTRPAGPWAVNEITYGSENTCMFRVA